jgi:hypothetical protein
MKKRYPIDFKKIAEESGKRSGNLAYSSTFKEWVVSDGNDPSMAVVTCPHGRVGDQTPDGEIDFIKIQNNEWVVDYKGRE